MLSRLRITAIIKSALVQSRYHFTKVAKHEVLDIKALIEYETNYTTHIDAHVLMPCYQLQQLVNGRQYHSPNYIHTFGKTTAFISQLLRNNPIPYREVKGHTLGKIKKLSEEGLSQEKIAEIIAADLTLQSAGINSNSHVDLTTSTTLDLSLRGTLWQRTYDNSGKSSLVMTDGKPNFDVLAIGGIDFDTTFHLSALLKSIELLTAGKTSVNAAAIFPFVDKITRYESAIEYNKNKLYYSTYIEQLTEKYVLPRFLDARNQLKEPDSPLSFYSFSVGGREVSMIENCLRDIFQKKFGCTNNEVMQLFSYLKALCIGYALDYDNLPKLRFTKNVVFSVDDVGVLRPKSLCHDILSNSTIVDTKVSSIQIPGYDSCSSTNLYILGHQTIQPCIKGKYTYDFHSLPHYTHTITNIPELNNSSLTILGLHVDN